MSSQALEIVRPVPIITVTEDQRSLARKTVAEGLNDSEFELYLYDCKRQGIHPLDRLLIPVVTKDDNGNRRLSMWSTIDLLRSRAAESNEYAGSEDPQFDYLEGANNPQAATVVVWRLVQGQRCAFTATARWSEYYPGDRRGFKWKQSPHIMLGKCAEALALRKAFPKQLGGLYAQEELERAEETSQSLPDKPEPIRPTTKKSVSPQAEVASPGKDKPQPASGDVKYINEGQLKRLFAIQGAAGMSDDTLKKWLAARGVNSRKFIPATLYEETINYIDPDFAHHERPENF